ncbi:MAG: carboxypeptidase regulatory-like domain-containing protein, partial [Ilumatobacteraceae bacterium]
MRLDNLTPRLNAAPGDRAICRLRIENTDPSPVLYRVRIVGFDESNVLRPPPTGPLGPGQSEEIDLEFVIPEAYAAGHHSVGIEVTPDRLGSAPVIAAVTVTVGTIDDVALAVVPSTIRGHRRGTFKLDIDNRSREAIDLELAGEGPDLAVRLRPDRVVIRPGERLRTSGKVKGPRHWFGESVQHSLTVTARSRSAPSYAPATFQQRPLLPRSLRTLLAILLVVAIWAGALGAGYLWWTNRQDEQAAETAALVDTDGDGEPDTPGNVLVDTNADGEPDTLASVVAEQVAAAAAAEEPPEEDGGADRPTSVVVGGSVKAGETGEDADIVVTLTPIDLGAEPTQPAAFVGPAVASRSAGKLWPARFGRSDPNGLPQRRQTVSVESAASGPDGAWMFPNVLIGQNYELSFSRPGFDTQSFVVTPPADGKPVQRDVVLEPAKGEVGGVVVGPGGALGNVDLVLTDGTLTFNSTTASGPGQGTFDLTGVSTPGTYTLMATLRGYGTEVLQVSLGPGEVRDGLRIVMTPNVGSITGRITAGGEPLGGVSLTASNGDVTLTTTSLTEGDSGLYTFPRLAIPGRYTVTAARDGYVSQSRLVTLDGNATDVDFNMVKTTG